jgi:[ribosomal protein S5]-alanine N-acetyltransferase
MIAPPFPEFPEIMSERIRMRELLQSDVENILEICFFNNVLAKNLQEASENIDKIEARYQEGRSVHWIIEDNASKEIVGTCGYYRGFDNDCGEVGYVMKEKFRGGGYMTEAVRLAVNFGFHEMKLKKVFATTAQDNLASQSVLRRNGFIAAGVAENGHLLFHILR